MIDKELSHRLLILAGILGAAGVGVGAFGAHGLESVLEGKELADGLVTQRLAQFDVGVRYHMYHALAVFALASLPFGTARARYVIAGLFALGILLFSGSLYALVLTETLWLGAITPIGGLIWIFAWLSLPFLARKRLGAYHAPVDSRSS
ncbi:MAG: DUF423 domain-containing protein [Pirellulaceae bacterium]